MTISRGRAELARSPSPTTSTHLPPPPSCPPHPSPPTPPPHETFQQDPPGLICPQTVKILTRPYTLGRKGNARFIFLSTERKAKNSLSRCLSLSPPHHPPLCRTCCVLGFCIVSFYLPHLAEMIAGISHTTNVLQIPGFRVLVNYYRTRGRSQLQVSRDILHTPPNPRQKKKIINK